MVQAWSPDRKAQKRKRVIIIIKKNRVKNKDPYMSFKLGLW